MTMATWKNRVIAKKNKGKQESGRSKGLVPPAWARACAKQARAYKNHPDYSKWCEVCDGSKVKWNKG